MNAPDAVRTKKLWSLMTFDELKEARQYYEEIEMEATSPFTILHMQALIKGCDNWIASRQWQRDYNARWETARRRCAGVLGRAEECRSIDSGDLVHDHSAADEVLAADQSDGVTHEH
jgi:hypothetical protein